MKNSLPKLDSNGELFVKKIYFEKSDHQFMSGTSLCFLVPYITKNRYEDLVLLAMSVLDV